MNAPPTCSSISSAKMQLRLLVMIFAVMLIATQSIPAEDARLLQQWRPNQANLDEGNIQSGSGGVAVPARPATFDQENLLVFSDGQFLVVKDGQENLPLGSLSAEAWVRIDRPTRWGCIIGFQQDNGAYEKGWSLGYNNDHFEFRVSDGNAHHQRHSRRADDAGRMAPRRRCL